MLGHLVSTHHEDDTLFEAPHEARWFTRLLRFFFGH